jgi:hypothetical protein
MSNIMEEGKSYWKVSTANGNRYLGIYAGNVVDIAFALADKNVRGLMFTHVPARHIKEFKPTANEVSICIVNTDRDRAKEIIQEEDRDIIIGDKFNYQIDSSIGHYYINLKVLTKEEIEARKAYKLLEENGIDVDTIKHYL